MKFTVEQDSLLLQLIKEKAGFESMTRARKLIKNGNVLIDGKIENVPTAMVRAGKNVTVSFSKKRILRDSKKKFPFKILFEDKFFMAFLKPAGFPIRTDNRKMRSIVSEIRFWMDANELGEEFYIINKIDKRESGVLIAARDMKSKKNFEPITDNMKFRYYALCEGVIAEDDLVLKQNFSRNKIGLLYLDRSGKGELSSEIKIRVMNRSTTNTLVKVDCEGHLKNEIRAHLSTINHPIVGDKKYKAKTNPIRKLGIHLFSLDFLHPETNEWTNVKTPVPKDFLDLIKKK